ncbi:MAG: hypothetical protein ABEN55_05595, partial [Bradymonadaceae bacterium]
MALSSSMPECHLRRLLAIATLLAVGAAGCQGISTDPGDRGDVDLYDVDTGSDVDTSDVTADTDTGGDGHGGDGNGGGDGGVTPPIPEPDPEAVPPCEASWTTYLTPTADGKTAQPDSDSYTAPPDDRRESLRLAMTKARQGHWDEARDVLIALLIAILL